MDSSPTTFEDQLAALAELLRGIRAAARENAEIETAVRMRELATRLHALARETSVEVVDINVACLRVNPFGHQPELSFVRGIGAARLKQQMVPLVQLLSLPDEQIREQYGERFAALCQLPQRHRLAGQIENFCIALRQYPSTNHEDRPRA